METMSVSSRTLCLTLEVLNGDILFLATTLIYTLSIKSVFRSVVNNL